MEGIRERLTAAFLSLQAYLGRRISQPEFVKMLNAKAGRGTAWTVSAVSKWGRTRVPTLEGFATYAAVTGADPGWLAFGKTSRAPGLSGLPIIEEIEAQPLPRQPAKTRRASGQG